MKFIVLIFMLFFASTAIAGKQTCNGPLKRSEAEFQVIGDGSELFDTKTKLTWKRCLMGATWDGSVCKNPAPDAVIPGVRVSYLEAIKYAESQPKAPTAWRVPTKAELISIREDVCYNPSQDLALFPVAPAWSSDGLIWTSTSEAKGKSVVSAIGSSDAWSVIDKQEAAHVRLVRSPPPKK